MDRIYLKYENGEYKAEINITVDEWKELLSNKDIFTEEAKKMVIAWYKEDGHQATHKTMIRKYYPNLKSTPYNGIVDGLTTRILKYLNRFEVIGTTGGKSKFIVPFEGWHEDYNPYKNFVWKLRKELVEAIEALNLVENIEYNSAEDELITTIEKNVIEGTKKEYYTTRYERSAKNRDAAIRYHGMVCAVCGFDFQKVYGEIGRGYIEVHHNKALALLDEPVEIDPKRDLDCVCSNCHRMLHRRKNQILTVTQLKNMIKRNLEK